MKWCAFLCVSMYEHVFVHGACLHACVCMLVYLCMCMSTCMCMHACGGWVTTFEHVCVCTCIHTCKHTHAHNIFACAWGVSDNASGCVNAFMCLYMVHVCMHVCACLYTCACA